MSAYHIRSGFLSELEFLQEIERRAGAIFADYEMAAIANDDPLSIESLSKYCVEERLWVAVDETDNPIAYIIIDLIDGAAHIEQVSVDPEYSGQRIGQALIDTVYDWAKRQNLPALTLTTFTNVPWNAPYYQRLGFQVIPVSQQSPGLQRVRIEERRHGLDQWPRVCMKRDIVY